MGRAENKLLYLVPLCFNYYAINTIPEMNGSFRGGREWRSRSVL